MDLQNKLIAVTGASGMLGAYLCRSLLASGARVRGVVRNPEKAAFLAREGVEFVKADLGDRRALTEAFRGCDAAVSNAALYAVANMRWADNYRANKEGTENVYEALGDAGVRRVVHISTFGVYQWFPTPRVFDETSPVIDGNKRQGGAYRATKQLSEALAFELGNKHGIQVTAVRPAGIYGARDSNMVPQVRMLMKSPIVPVPRFHFPFVYAGDVANAVVGALKNDGAAGKAYLIAGRGDTVEDFFRAWKSVTGGKNAILPIPLGYGFRIDTTLAEREIGFHNRSYEDGLRETFADEKRYREAGIS